MHTVCETNNFRRAAEQSGMADDEITALVSMLAGNSQIGDEIVGTGGCRKLRFARPGGGKRSGYRVITFYSGYMMPVFLLTVFAKGEKANLTSKEKAALKDITALIVSEYNSRVVQARAGART